MGYTVKSAGLDVQGEMEKISRYTRREFAPEELYLFRVALCDNEIDRDGERFTIDALRGLAELYRGKTGIFDHSGRGTDQSARIYDTCVEVDADRRTSVGEPYARLIGSAYLPRTEKNKDLILELEAGIKKEVSVGCAVASVTCSICGADWRKGGCSHQKGEVYDGKLCCAVLDQPTDAYEWSFVAVPAQREAGVVKAFAPEGGIALREIRKMLEKPGRVELTHSQAEALLREWDELEKQAELGRLYREKLCGEVAGLYAVLEPGLDAGLMRRAAERMEIGDLQELEKSLRRCRDQKFPAVPQLSGVKLADDAGENSAFRI